MIFSDSYFFSTFYFSVIVYCCSYLLFVSEQKIVSDIVQTLGSYVLSENVNDQTTHVVSGGNRRTVKVLAGISRGLWIVSLDWVSIGFLVKSLKF